MVGQWLVLGGSCRCSRGPEGQLQLDLRLMVTPSGVREQPAGEVVGLPGSPHVSLLASVLIPYSLLSMI